MIPALLDHLRGLHTPGVLLLAAIVGVPFGLIALVVASTVGYMQTCRQAHLVRSDQAQRAVLQAVTGPYRRRR